MVDIGQPKEAQWWYEEGRRVAQIDTQCLHCLLGDQWPTTVHPFCDHDDVCAFILPPLSDLWATDLLGDLCATVLNMLKTSRRPWRPWRCLNVLCATLERPRQPFGLPSAFNGDLASFVVAQGRHKGRSPCVKGVLATWAQFCKDCYINLHSLLPSHWDSMAVVVGLGWCMTVLSPDVTFHIQQRMGYNCNPNHFLNFNIRSV